MKFAGLLATALVAVSFSTATAATSLPYDFTEVFSGTAPPGVTDPLTAIFTAGDQPGTVNLTMTANGVGNMYFSEVYFNLRGVDIPNLEVTPGADNTQQVTSIALGSDAFKAGGDGYYDLLFKFPTSNRQDRFTGSDTVTFTIAGEGLTVDSFSDRSVNSHLPLYAATHLQGYADGGSGWFAPGETPPVPEPGTIMLFGAGLLGISFLRRRRG